MASFFLFFLPTSGTIEIKTKILKEKKIISFPGLARIPSEGESWKIFPYVDEKSPSFVPSFVRRIFFHLPLQSIKRGDSKTKKKFSCSPKGRELSSLKNCNEMGEGGWLCLRRKKRRWVEKLQSTLWEMRVGWVASWKIFLSFSSFSFSRKIFSGKSSPVLCVRLKAFSTKKVGKKKISPKMEKRRPERKTYFFFWIMTQTEDAS
jgi:hypothetical protein